MHFNPMELLFLVNHRKVFLKTPKVNLCFFLDNRFDIQICFFLDDDDDSGELEDETKSKKSKRALNDGEFEEVPIDQRMSENFLF